MSQVTGSQSTTSANTTASSSSSSSAYDTATATTNNNSSSSSNSGNNNATSPTNSLDPSQVFLQLFQTQNSYTDESQQPLLIPDNETIRRSLNFLDYLPCYLTHKIGVVYVGPNQAHNEKAILSNSNGSVRYRNFIKGLGNLVYLKNMDTLRFYSGGLETDGSVGDFTFLWYDGIIQVTFHVTTMMSLRDEDTNFKKKHIGNDSCIIVYNESGEEYQFNMIKVPFFSFLNPNITKFWIFSYL